MVLAYTDIESVTGLTFAAADAGDKIPTQANITAFITAAKNRFQGAIGTAATETAGTTDWSILVDMVMNSIEWWHYYRAGASASNNEGGTSRSRSPPKAMTDDEIRARMATDSLPGLQSCDALSDGGYEDR